MSREVRRLPEILDRERLEFVVVVASVKAFLPASLACTWRPMSIRHS